MKLLETLASDYKSDKEFVSKRVPGTCEWFLQDDRFLNWRDSDTSRLLWVSAGPGCGKSVLARALIDERKVCTDTTDSTICYFFFKDGQEQRTRGTNALSALLHQLFKNTDLIRHALDSHERHGKELRNRFSELWEVLFKCAEDSKAGKIICVLDALDECEGTARDQLIGKLVEFVSKETCQHPSVKLKFLATSRPYDYIQHKLERLSAVSTYIHFDGDEKSQQIGEEINLVIDAKIPHITGGFDLQERNHICKSLKGMENRTYLWLFLTIDIIEKFPSNFRRKSDLDALLSNLPSNISDAYDKMLERSTDERKARILLEVIVAATRPLALMEANLALAIATRGYSCASQRDLELWPLRTFGTTVRNWCGLFVSVHDGKLSLIHQTAREFLTETSKSARNSSHKWEGCLDLAAAHGTMSQICLNYLHFQEFASIDESQLNPFSYDKLAEEYNLLDYAANHWATHYKFQPSDVAKASLNVAMKLCNMSSAGGWFLVHCTSQDLKVRGWTNLGIASHLGLVNVAEQFLDEGTDGNAECSPYGSALVTASRKGRDQVVRMLLDKGVDIHTQCGPWDDNALQAASEYGHNQIVRILLDKGADVNAHGGSYGNALQAASIDGHDQIVQLLLDKGADVNAQGGWYDNALQAASIDGHDQIVQMLLDKGADVNAQGGNLRNALQAASYSGRDRNVQILLDRGAIDIDGEALKAASRMGHDNMVRMLLDKWGEYYAQNSDALSLALALASRRAYDQVVQMLLDQGAIDVDCRALKSASKEGHGHIVRILLDRRREYYVQYRDALNLAMEMASKRGCNQVVQMLLDKGATDIGGEALKQASAEGHDHIVRMLLDKRREYYAQYIDLLNIAMNRASMWLHDEVVQTLQEFQRSFE